MKVIKHVKSTGEKSKVEYPAIWGEPVYRLDEDITYYEIQILPYPENYDVHKHELIEVCTITDNIGTFLNVCLIEWQLVDKPQSSVLEDFNNVFGAFIDVSYPMWRRVKDISFPSESGTLRQEQELALRQERQNREDNYVNNNIFPDFNFKWL